MDVSLFDFDLPDARIALRPADPRDSARMLVVHADGRLDHCLVRDLPRYLAAGDAMVSNNSLVVPARLFGVRMRPTGSARVEVLLHRRLSPQRYAVLAKPARKLVVGDVLDFSGLKAQVSARGEGGDAEITFALSGAELDAAIARTGVMPLPPYIASKRKADARDLLDYQTLFARNPGSVAAPTAGLHFTPKLMSALGARGILQESVTLHVGLGTFLPVTAADTAAHHMHAEQATLSAEAAERLNAVHGRDGRVLAIGTTSLRTLESAAAPDGKLAAYGGDTEIFITPGYGFRAVDRLMTNFHLPRSTLFMLVCAFMGLDVMRAAYAEAIASDYRFYSYGDACLLLRR